MNDADGAVSWPNDETAADMRVWVQNPSVISGYPFSYSMLAQLGPDSDGYLLHGQVGAGGTYQAYLIRADIAGPPGYSGGLYAVVKGVGGTRGIYTTRIVGDDAPHLFTVVWASSSSSLIYMDGEDVTTIVDTATPTFGGATGGYGLGNTLEGAGPSGLPLTGATLDEFCVWDGKALSAERVAAHSLAAKTGWDGDDTGERVGRFLDALNWPATLRNISTGISILGPASWSAGSSALSVLQDWAATEYGMFFADPSGRLTWYSRHRPYVTAAAMTSQATFGDTHSGETLKYVADGFEMGRDETRIRNPVTASRAGGVSVTVRDTEYEEKYGTRTWASPTTQDQLDSAVRDRATWLVRRYKEIGTRVSAFQLSPRTDASDLWPQALGRAIGDRITIERTPLGTGNQISVAQIIEGVRHRFSPRSWTTSFHCSPVDPDVGNYLILDDATYGLLDTHRTAY